MVLSTIKDGFKTVVIPVLIVVISIVVFAYFKSTKPEALPVEIKQKVWAVDVVTVKMSDKSARVNLFGKVESSSLVTVSSPVSGVIGDLGVQEGSGFIKGQKIISLSDLDLKPPLRFAKAEVVDIVAQQNLAELSHKANKKRLKFEAEVLEIRKKSLARNQKLLTKNLVSPSDLEKIKESLVRQEMQVIVARLLVDEYQPKKMQLEARLSKAQVDLQQAEVNLARGRVMAPFDGRVAKVFVSEGDKVQSGTNLLSFYALDGLELRAKIPFENIAMVNESLISGQTMFAEWVVNGEVYNLPLVRLSGEADASGMDAFFSLPQGLKITRPGNLLQVSLVGKLHENVFSVPASALFGLENIYIVDNGKLHLKKVKNLGKTLVNGRLEVLLKGNLKSGNKVLITPLPNAMSGLKVLVSEQ